MILAKTAVGIKIGIEAQATHHAVSVGLTAALAVLEGFYAKSAAAAAAFIQRQEPAGPPPPPGFEEYKKSAAGGGVRETPSSGALGGGVVSDEDAWACSSSAACPPWPARPGPPGGADAEGEDHELGILGAMQLCNCGDVFLAAERAELRVAALSASDSDSGGDGGEITVFLKLHGLSKLRMPWTGRGSGGHRHRLGKQPRILTTTLQPINESPPEAADAAVPGAGRRRTS